MIIRCLKMARGPLRYVAPVRNFCLMIGIVCVLLVGLEASARTYYLFRTGILTNHPEIDKSSSWRVNYAREFKESGNTVWHSYVYWRRKPYSGKYINIDSNGIRKTYNVTPLPEARLKIFMFGGSAMWGTGTQDDQTIPSFISKILNEKGYRDFYVTNFGESGYVSTQEVIQLMLEIKKGNVPDIVIFYDGANDVFSTFQNGIAGIPSNEDHRRREFNLLGKNVIREISFSDWLKYHSAFVKGLTNLKNRLASMYEKPVSDGGGQIGRSEPSIPVLSETTIRAYLANIELVAVLAGEFHFETYFFWQPTIFSKAHLSSEEEKFKKSCSNTEKLYRLVDSKVRLLEDEIATFRDLQNIFSEIEETVFIDCWHVEEAGNRMIADAITQVLIEKSLVL